MFVKTEHTTIWQSYLLVGFGHISPVTIWRFALAGGQMRCIVPKLFMAITVNNNKNFRSLLTSEVFVYTSILTGFSRNSASFCMNWAAYPEGYDVGAITDAVIHGDGGFCTLAAVFSTLIS